MKILNAVIEKNGLFKKEEVTVHIYLDPIEGTVTVRGPDKKLEAKIQTLLDFPKNYIKTQAISEETFIINRIGEILKGRRLNGAVVTNVKVQDC